MPPLADPNFDRTVVFLFKRDDDGAAGVILNRPSRTEVADVLPGWGHVVPPPAVLFNGGPVGDTTGVGVGVHGDDIDIVDLNVPPDQSAAGGTRVRIFLGFAGWTAGQLEEELLQGAWIVGDATPADILSDHPTGLWRETLRRQGGRTAWLANMPLDPAVN
jgi:putative transcriptional regulator